MTTYIFAHYLNGFRSFQSYVCKQNLISSTAHTVRTVHTRKVGLTAFGTKRWLCEYTVHTHSHGHKYTMSNPSDLFTNSYIVGSFTNMGIYCRNDLPGTSPLAECPNKNKKASTSTFSLGTGACR